jgi:5-methylcytosine-specific restriction endonuclease McrA
MDATTMTSIEEAFATITAIFSVLVENGQTTLIAVGALFAISLFIKVYRKFNKPHKDDERLYSKQDRMIGFARAGGRCEMDGFLWFLRCGREAKHGDHHYPHSKGGATTMQNFVAACVRCNTSKGAKVPTFMQTKRIQNRRRSYFPKSVPVTAGERITRQSRKLAAANAKAWN